MNLIYGSSLTEENIEPSAEWINGIKYFHHICDNYEGIYVHAKYITKSDNYVANLLYAS